MSAIRKHFFRAQQFAAETMDKSAKKTDALSAELVEVEEQVKGIKQVYTEALKRVQELLPSFQHFKGTVPVGSVEHTEKRLKKQSTWALGNSLIEGSTIVESNQFLQETLHSCGDTLVLMAKQSVRFEIDLYERVISSMSGILTEIKEIDILKKKLSRARLDMDSANGAVRRRQKGHEPDPQLISDAENATNHFNMAQDAYVTALLSFSSKELDHIKPIQELLKCQQRLFNDVSNILNEKLPTIQDNITKSANNPVFGMDLDKHLEHTGKPVATVLKKCCSSLLKSGIEQPGIFRLAGGLPQLRKLKAMFDSNRMEEDEWEQDVFTLAQAIKLYLRELPEPLLTFDMFDSWIKAVCNPKVKDRLPMVKDLVDKLPKNFHVNLQYLIWFLSQVAAREPENKMGAHNLGLVLGPNILREKDEDDNESITALNAASALTEMLIVNYSTLFPYPLPADITRSSLPRAGTISGGISPARPSIRSHKKGKAPPTPKRPGAAPTPPPRVDLDKTPSATSNLNSSVSLDGSKGISPLASPAPNPFGESDEEDGPEPPKRKIDMKVEAPSPAPTTSPEAPLNPFGESSVEDVSPIEVAVKDHGDANPFGESDDDGEEEEGCPSPLDVVVPSSSSPRQSPRGEKPVPSSQSPTTTPSRPKATLASTSFSSFEEDVQGEGSRTPERAPALGAAAAPASSGDGTTPKTPTHSRNTSTSSTHSRQPSDQSKKPPPPPRVDK